MFNAGLQNKSLTNIIDTTTGDGRGLIWSEWSSPSESVRRGVLAPSSLNSKVTPVPVIPRPCIVRYSTPLTYH